MLRIKLPSNVKIIVGGDIINSTDTIICHQCNCITNNSFGLAKFIFDKFPYTNTYNNSTVRIPGTISLHGNGTNKRYIINIYGQNAPSKPTTIETAEIRLTWFQQCLNIMGCITGNIESIGIPYNIGCDLAGGNWLKDYLPSIIKLAERRPDIKFNIYDINKRSLDDGIMH